MAKKTDQQTLDLIKEVQRRKDEISKLQKPNWLTNCSFTYTEGRMNEAVNIHVQTNVRDLVNMAAFLRHRENNYNEAADFLGVEAPAFTWSGFTAADWLEDIKTRINQIQITSKQKKLAALESRLGQIISPELRAQMELEAIASELS